MTTDFETSFLAGRFGIEVRGIDLATCGAQDHARIVDLFNRHGVLVVRDQRLSPEAQIAFTRAFGEPEANQRPEYTHPDIPEIYVLSNKQADGRRIGDIDAGQGWHTDSSYLAQPVRCTMLYAMEVPDEGSDTLMTDLCAAWDALPPERQAMLEGAKVRHSWSALMALKGVAVDPATAMPDVDHPLVRTHPADGRKALWVSTGVTTGIVGMDNPAGLDLLADLVAFATQDRFVYRHKWRVGDVLVWDNRCTLHTGTRFDYARYTRHVHRSWVKGETPL